MREERSFLSVKLAALKRYLMWHYISDRLGLVLVSEFPKSGGSWLCQMLSEATDLPFPRNESPNFEPSIMHGHYLYSQNFPKTLCVLRDGRDVMVSAYFHFLMHNDKNPDFLVEEHRSNVPFNDYENIKKNMPLFLEYMFTDFQVGGTKCNWSIHFNSYDGKDNVQIIKYEDMLDNASRELRRALDFLGESDYSLPELDRIEKKYSFESQSNRSRGDENTKSFLRKGVAGDWKNKFTSKASKVFDEFAGEELINAGYEKNHNWY